MLRLMSDLYAFKEGMKVLLNETQEDNFFNYAKQKMSNTQNRFFRGVRVQ